MKSTGKWKNAVSCCFFYPAGLSAVADRDWSVDRTLYRQNVVVVCSEKLEKYGIVVNSIWW